MTVNMTLGEYRALSEEDRMKAAINSLAQVAMLPSVERRGYQSYTPRRVAPVGAVSAQTLKRLEEAVYGGRRRANESEETGGPASPEGPVIPDHDEGSAIQEVTAILRRHDSLSDIVEILGFNALSENDQDIWRRGEAILDIVYDRDVALSPTTGSVQNSA